MSGQNSSPQLEEVLKTLVLGLGNPILSDDSVGFRVAQALEGRFDPGRVTVMESSLAGLSLLDLVAGYERAIIVDSIQTQGGKAGTIYRLTPADFEVAHNSTTLHDVGLLTALKLGQRLELDMPREVILFAVEGEDLVTFSEKCSPEVEKAIPVVVDLILKEVASDTPAPNQ